MTSSLPNVSGPDTSLDINRCPVNKSSFYNSHLAPSARFFSSEESNSPKSDRIEEVEPIAKKTHEFQAETRQLLDIVTHSLYTDKEVFLRELVSNASDALEKLRHVQVASGDSVVGADVPLEIRIETDELNGTLTITDTGIGLTHEEMVNNLGTIARSGSKAFVNEMSESAKTGGALDASRGIIGKFGVGFYSAFMVGDKVEVRSKSAYKKEEGNPALAWISEGVGSYDIGELPSDIRQERGSSIVIHLNEENIEYADEKRVENVLKKYSNFVNFPIFLNGNRVNTMEAVWALEPNKVEDETYAPTRTMIRLIGCTLGPTPQLRLRHCCTFPRSIPKNTVWVGWTQGFHYILARYLLRANRKIFFLNGCGLLRALLIPRICRWQLAERSRRIVP